MKFNEVARDRINIIIGCHLLNPTLINKIPKSTIILNTEQIYSDDTSWNSTIFEWARRFETWDYSAKNIQKLNSLGISKTKHLKIGFQKELQRIEKAAVQEIDVLFYGSRNSRRIKILEALSARGLKVKALFGIYGAERDRYIRRSKVVLNHHFYKSQIFEVVRVFYLLHNKAAIVAEINDTTSVEDRWRKAVIGAPYDDLVDTCYRLSKDALGRSCAEENGLEILKSYPQASFTAEVLGKR